MGSPEFSGAFRSDPEFDTNTPGRSRTGLERELSTSSSINENPYSRVQSLHGVIEHPARPVQGGAIAEEPAPESRLVSSSDLARELEREEDIGTQRAALNSAEWYEERKQTSTSRQHSPQLHQPQGRKFSPRQSSLRTDTPVSEQSHHQQQGYSQPRHDSLGHPGTLSPLPRSSSWSSAGQQQFPDRQRFNLVDSGPISAPSSPVTAGTGRAVSDSYSAPGSPTHFGPPGGTRGHPSSAGFAPPQRRSPRGGPTTLPSSAGSQSGTPKYATFQEMGIRGRGMAEAQAEDAKECVIM
ncbi:hypothetical protein M0805_005426 [Coniferiporia weirii]|nr:hypothetical protein M0805_005426 [Coniferiporia weirii]